MKPSRILNLVLGTFLAAAMALTAQAEAQTVENPQAVAYFEAGVAAYERNNLPLAYQEFLAAAKQGHADAQFNVAMMYEQGIGVGKNEQEAVAWYGESAEQGSSAAQFNLGVLYENGRGTPIDYAKANKWYRKASVQGDAWGLAVVPGVGYQTDKWGFDVAVLSASGLLFLAGYEF